LATVLAGTPLYLVWSRREAGRTVLARSPAA
jgi:hypothetical protein